MFYLNVHLHFVAITVLRLWNDAVFYLQPGVGQVNPMFPSHHISSEWILYGPLNSCPIQSMGSYARRAFFTNNITVLTVSLLNLKLSQ
jgi:hypothetical protein